MPRRKPGKGIGGRPVPQRGAPAAEALTDFQTARDLVLERIVPVTGEIVDPAESLGRIAAEMITADFDIPPFPNAAMDGYALRSEDTAGAARETPVRMKVTAGVFPGDRKLPELRAGEAATIMTGAPLPPGADAVMMKEEAERAGDTLVVRELVPAGEYVRAQGEDFPAGSLLLEPGRVIRPQELGIIASLGRVEVAVYRKPVVGILATGNELQLPGAPRDPGKIFSSNTATLIGQVRQAGGLPVNYGVAGDDREEITARIRRMLPVDLLLTSGGISVGDRDYVPAAFQTLCRELFNWKLKMNPGRPLLFGMIGTTPVFGLPGNPVASMLSFHLFVRPALKKLGGAAEWFQAPVKARLCSALRKAPGSVHLVRARTRNEGGRWVADKVGPPGSANLASMANANSIIIVPEDETALPAGAEVDVIFLSELPGPPRESNPGAGTTDHTDQHGMRRNVTANG